MIVVGPPYDLIVLFADLDARAFFCEIINRAEQMHCIRPLKWLPVSDTMHDALCKCPERALGPYLRSPAHFLMVWDHDGSGCEMETVETSEKCAENALIRCNVSENRVCGVALHPELEGIMVRYAYERTKEKLAELRKTQPPLDDEVFRRACKVLATDHPKRRQPSSLNEARDKYPKEVLKAICSLLRLKYGAELMQDTLGKLPLGLLKQDRAFLRITTCLQTWFPISVSEGRSS